jgi:hypothetical protein
MPRSDYADTENGRGDQQMTRFVRRRASERDGGIGDGCPGVLEDFTELTRRLCSGPLDHDDHWPGGDVELDTSGSVVSSSF